MSEDRIDIVVTDKVDASISDKFRSIATAARDADTAVDKLKADLAGINSASINQLAAAQARLTNATAREIAAKAKLLDAETKSAVSKQKIATETAKTEIAQNKASLATEKLNNQLLRNEVTSASVAAAQSKAATAANNLAISNERLAVSQIATTKANFDAERSFSMAVAAENKAIASAQLITDAQNKTAISGNNLTISNEKLATSQASTVKANFEAERSFARALTAENDAASSAQRFIASQKQAEIQTAKLTSEVAKTTIAEAQSAVAKQKLATEAARTATASSQAAAASMRLESAMDREFAATMKAEGALLAHAQAARTAAAAANDVNGNLASIIPVQQRLGASLEAESQAQAVSNGLRDQAGKTAGFASHQMANMAAQLQDVVVSLQGGQAPLTVFLQQGSQIASILGPGQGGLTGILRLAAASAMAFLAPFAPLIATLAAAGAAVFALQQEIQKATGVNVTFGQTIRAVWRTISDGVSSVLGPAISAITPYFKKAYDTVLSLTRTYINTLTNYWVKGTQVIGVIFGAAMENGFSAAMQLAYNAVIEGLAQILEAVANAAFEIQVVLSNAIERAGNSIGMELPNPFAKMDFDATSSVETVRGWKKDVTSSVKDAQAEIDGILSRPQTDYAGQFFKAVSGNAVDIFNEDAAAEKKGGRGGGRKKGGGRGGAGGAVDELTQALSDVKGPLENYQKQIGYLDTLLKQGKISQEQYNAAVGKLDLVSQLREVDKNLPGYANEAEKAQLQQNANEQIAIVQMANEAKILNEQQTADRIRAIRSQLNTDTTNLMVEQYRLGAEAMEYGFGDFAAVLKDAAGEQSGVYRAMFAVSKAFAIAQASIAIYQNIAEAMKVGFPQNLPFIGAAISQGATIMASLSSISGKGFQSGGYTGNMPTNAVAGAVHGKEFVAHAAATRAYRPQLEAMNRGENPFTATPSVGKSSSTPPKVTIINNGTPQEMSVRSWSRDEIVMIAKDQVAKDAPKVFSADMSNPNGRTSKAIQKHTTASRKL